MATAFAVGQPPGQQRWVSQSIKSRLWGGGPPQHIGRTLRPRGRTELPYPSASSELNGRACLKLGMLLPDSDGREGMWLGCPPELGPCGSSSKRDGLGQRFIGNASASGTTLFNVFPGLPDLCFSLYCMYLFAD